MDTSTVTALFELYQRPLRRRLRGLVNTSEANLDDACAYAWMKLVRHEGDLGEPLAWLTTVAAREAVKLDRRYRQAHPLTQTCDGGELQLADRRLALARRDELLDAQATLRRASLTDRQRRMLMLHAAGYSYHEIAALTRDSLRTVERQLLRARAAIRQAAGG